jgi:tRNA-specific 2-thiouridylase
MKKVLVAMSGGVDSSVAAALLKDSGYECLGATMRLYHNDDAGLPQESTCCSLDDIEDARSVAYRLGMHYYVFDFSADFKRMVIDRFIDAYEQGLTPNPCIDCNRYLKFERLYRRATELGCDYVATGHYARIVQDSTSGRYQLKKALDKSKDQSYVLYSLSQEQLAHTLFPLGNMTKAETRAFADSRGFVSAHKKDSQDICFVPDGDYARVIELHTKRKYPCGNFVDVNGNILGSHKGIIHYTIGQRKGLGLALSEPMYVKQLDVQSNNVVLARNEELFSKEFDVSDFNWIAFDCPEDNIRAKVKVRYRHDEQSATITPTSATTVHIEFDEPQRAITKGQAAVVYDGDNVIGGGTIV